MKKLSHSEQRRILEQKIKDIEMLSKSIPNASS